MDTYKILLEAHSGFRYVVLLLIALALIQSLTGWLGRKNYTEANRKINLFAMVSAHIQFLLGLILYFFSPFVRIDDMAGAMKDNVSRYWTVEHAVMMLFAVVLFTIGYSKSKRIVEAAGKHRTIAIFYGLGILVIIIAILQSGRPIIGQ
ncbi:MAG TPA: cytochrome B [Sphingobacteriaceae bacterium]|nr:cytochrome B [Sphingobacteriaceae bacterium]